jgi:hypothetical protein
MPFLMAVMHDVFLFMLVFTFVFVACLNLFIRISFGWFSFFFRLWHYACSSILFWFDVWLLWDYVIVIPRFIRPMHTSIFLFSTREWRLFLISYLIYFSNTAHCRPKKRKNLLMCTPTYPSCQKKKRLSGCQKWPIKLWFFFKHGFSKLLDRRPKRGNLVEIGKSDLWIHSFHSLKQMLNRVIKKWRHCLF